MSDKKPLPTSVSTQLDEILTRAGQAKRGGDHVEGERLSLQAWDMLPEPKLNWDFYSNIMPRNNMLFFRDTNQFEKAVYWLQVTRQAYGPGRDQSVEFMAATLWFEMGDFGRAYEEFDRQFKDGKSRPFQGKDRKYLDFYLERKKQ